MRRLSLFVGILYSAFGVIAAQGSKISKNDATDMVINEILAQDIGKVDIFISKNPISSASVLALHNKEIPCPYSSNWVIFVDDRVYANWDHPCRYIFINTQRQEFQVVQVTTPPETMSSFDTISTVKRPQAVLLQATPLLQATTQTVATNPHCYAIIINGGINDGYNFVRYWNDMSAIYCTLTQVYGFAKGNIYVHSTDGTKVHNYGSLDLDNDGVDDINHPASYASVSSTFQTLANVIGPGDQLFVFVTDHGGIGSLIYLWGSDFLTPSVVKNMLAPINAAEIIVVMEQCYSGGYIDGGFSLVGPHRDIQTACDIDETSNQEWWLTNQNYDEFTFYWTSAARGYYPTLTGTPWVTTYQTGNFPFTSFPGFSTHPSDYNPDLNGDGIVEMQEALSYANNFDTWSMVGYYNPWGGSGSESPQPSHNIGFQEDLLSLTGISGTITNSQTVNGNFIIRGNLSVNSGVNLNVEAGSQFFSASGVEFIVNGELDAQGTSWQPINFDKSGSSSWYGLILQSGSSGTVSYCNFNNATVGVTCNSSVPTISSCQFRNDYFGIYCNPFCSPTIQNNDIENCSNSGIYLSQASPVLNSNVIKNNSQFGIWCHNSSSPGLVSQNTISGCGTAGLYCEYSSSPILALPATGGHNVIANNGAYGVETYSASNPLLGSGNARGGNSVFGNQSYDVAAFSNCTVTAEWTFWSNPNKFYASGSTIDFANQLLTNPNPGRPKIQVPGEGILAQSIGPTADSTFNLAFQDALLGKYDDAIALYLKVFNTAPSTSFLARQALLFLAETYERSGKSDFLSYLQNQINLRAAATQDLAAISRQLEAHWLTKGGRYMDAIKVYQGLHEDYPDNPEIDKLALFTIGEIYHLYLNNRANELGSFTLFQSKYPNDPLTPVAGLLMSKATSPFVPLQQKGGGTVSSKDLCPTTYELEFNYPNPFNPSTQIGYSMPEAGKASLIIYDVLGREIVSLTDGYQQAGRHTVTWNSTQNSGIPVSSGVYLARLRVLNELGVIKFAKTIKLLLTK